MSSPITPPYRLTATEAAAQIRAGTLTVEAYAQSLLAHIQARDPTIHAWAHLNPAQVLAQARALDQIPSSQRGPLHGVAVAVKDIIWTKDMPTSHNSSIYADPAQSSPDAGSVMILRHAGALLLGKTTTPEFAAVTDLPAEGRTVNPHDTSRSAGGSSTGSAAAVADFQAPLALGTQTAGSVVRPASFCGVWGFKPTWGAVTREGQKTCAVTLDTLGWMGRSGKDLEVLAEVFGIRDDDDNDDDDDKERKEEIGGLEGKKFGVMKTVMWAKHAEPATVAALDKAVALLKAHGAVVEEIELPGDLVELPKWHEIVMAAEAGKAFLPEYTVGKDKLHDLLVGHVENRNRFSHADYLRASDGIAVARPRVDELLGQYEAVLTPSAPGEAPVGPGWTGSPAFNLIWTALHVPVVNVPGLGGENGMPVGVSLVAPRYKDRKLLAVSKAVGKIIEAEGGWKSQLS